MLYFKNSLFLFSVCILLIISGCATQQKQPVFNKKSVSSENIQNNKIKKSLYLQHKEWKGTRYKLGGLSKKGIDCSGFVHVTFASRFGKKIPRTTRTQAKVGTNIAKRNLKTGDLVFFKTSPTVNHVGIYLENGQFLHASSSKGVMISRLDNVYWTRKYWKAVRLKI